MVDNFVDGLEYLEDVGFYDVALPFLLIFTLIFAVLQKLQLFGDHSKRFNAVIALAIAFFAVRSETTVATMNNFLPQVSLWVLLVVALLIVIGIGLGKKTPAFTDSLAGVFVIIVVVGIVLNFLTSAGVLGDPLSYVLDVDLTDYYFFFSILAAIVFILIMTAGWSPEKRNPNPANNILKQIGDAIGGGN